MTVNSTAVAFVVLSGLLITSDSAYCNSSNHPYSLYCVSNTSPGNICINTNSNSYNTITYERNSEDYYVNLLKRNLETVAQFETLEENWDGYGAKPINKKILTEAYTILKNIKIQPEVYPTPNGYIQMEFYLANEKYLEIKLTDKDIVLYYDDTKTDELYHFEYSSKNTLYEKIKGLGNDD